MEAQGMPSMRGSGDQRRLQEVTNISKGHIGHCTAGRVREKTYSLLYVAKFGLRTITATDERLPSILVTPCAIRTRSLS